MASAVAWRGSSPPQMKAISPKNSPVFTMLMRRFWRTILTSPLAAKKKLSPVSPSRTMFCARGTRDHLPARASSQISASDRPESIGTRFSETNFSLSGMAPGGSTSAPRRDSSKASSFQVAKRWSGFLPSSLSIARSMSLGSPLRRLEGGAGFSSRIFFTSASRLSATKGRLPVSNS